MARKPKNPKKPIPNSYKKKKDKVKLKKKKYDVVKCYWHDITTQGGWVAEAEIEGLETCNVITIGLLVAETKDLIKIASSITLEKDEEFSDVTTIPRVVVKDVIKIDTIDKEPPKEDKLTGISKKR